MEYNIIVNFTEKTVSQLNKNGCTLIYFSSSFSNTAGSAFPLCCGLVDTFLQSLKITLKSDLFAYVSSSNLGNHGEIYIDQNRSRDRRSNALLAAQTSTSIPIKLGETLTLDSGLMCKRTQNKSKSDHTINIKSESSKRLTAGIGIIENINNVSYYLGINAQTLYSPTPLRVIPGRKLLLAILPNRSITTNMAVNSLSEEFIVIDLSKNPTEPLEVTYSLENGWEFGGDSKVTLYHGTDDLRSILISPLN